MGLPALCSRERIGEIEGVLLPRNAGLHLRLYDPGGNPYRLGGLPFQSRLAAVRPSSRVAISASVKREMESLRKRTEPSQKAALTPPMWQEFRGTLQPKLGQTPVPPQSPPLGQPFFWLSW